MDAWWRRYHNKYQRPSRSLGLFNQMKEVVSQDIGRRAWSTIATYMLNFIGGAKGTATALTDTDT